MKNWMTTALIALFTFAFTLSGSAQDTPQRVKDAFTGKYPKAAKVEWEKNDEKDEAPGYEVEFDLDGQAMEALFGTDGTWKHTEQDIENEALPEAVKRALKAKYSQAQIESVGRLDTPEGVRYEVDLEQAGKAEMIQLLYTEDGSLVEETTEPDDEDDDDGWFSFNA